MFHLHDERLSQMLPFFFLIFWINTRVQSDDRQGELLNKSEEDRNKISRFETSMFTYLTHFITYL